MIILWYTVAAPYQKIFSRGHRGGKMHFWGSKNPKNCQKLLILALFFLFWLGAACVGGRASDGGTNAPLMLPLDIWFIPHQVQNSQYKWDCRVEINEWNCYIWFFNRIVIGWHKQLEPCWMTEVLLQRYSSDEKEQDWKGIE